MHHLSFSGGAVIQKKKSGDEGFEFLAAYAALGGFAARSENSTTTHYRQLRRLGRKMFKILGKWENKLLDLGVVKNWNVKWIICRQLPDSPPPQQLKGASDPFSGLTALVYVYTFSNLIYFLPKSTSFPQKTNCNAFLTSLFLKLEIKVLLSYTTFGCLIYFIFQKKARTPRGKYINSESGITLTPVKKADNS